MSRMGVEERRQQRGKEDVGVLKMQGCVVLSEVEVGRNPEPREVFACLPGRVGRGNEDLMSVAVFIGPVIYFYHLVQCS